MKKIIILLVLIICSVNIILGQHVDEKRHIVGVWCAEEGSWKLIFTSAMKCYEYFDSKLSDIYTYKISNTSPQCGIKVPVDKNENLGYIELTNVKDRSKTCYEINGVSSKSLSLSSYAFGLAGVQLFYRQTNSKPRKK